MMGYLNTLLSEDQLRDFAEDLSGQAHGLAVNDGGSDGKGA
jgi:hypothetical protein